MIEWWNLPHWHIAAVLTIVALVALLWAGLEEDEDEP